MPRRKLAPWHAYARDVAAGRIVAGELVRLACRRHLADLKRYGRDRSRKAFYFDEAAAEHVVEFFGFLRHSKGRWAGQRFELSPWQLFVVGSLFGWRRRDGTRRFRTAYVQIARKNGKSTFAAGIGLYLFMEDGEPGAEVYTAATKQDQAKIIHEEAARMLMASEFYDPEAGDVRIVRNNLSHLPSASKYEPLGADANTLDGLNVHATLADELHAWPSRKLWDVLDTATGARAQPLMLAITTSGSDQTSLCGEIRDLCLKVLRGVFADPSIFAYVAELDEKDDWREPDVWIKANPNLGVSVQSEYLAGKVRRAQVMTSEQNAVRRLHLNEWTRADTRFLDLARWDACAGDELPAEIEARCEGRRAWMGLDLSAKTDLTSLALVFEPEDDGDPYDVVMRFWVPESRVEDALNRGIPYDAWSRERFLSLTPGGAVDYAFIHAEIESLRDRYNLNVVGFDPWNATEFAQKLEAGGMTPIQVRQGYVTLSEPTKGLEVAVLQRRLCHGAHPVLRWNIDNLEVDTDPAGNVKPRKPEHKMSHRKIDGAVALIMALHLAMKRIEGVEQPGPSRYETEGIRTT